MWLWVNQFEICKIQMITMPEPISCEIIKFLRNMILIDLKKSCD